VWCDDSRNLCPGQASRCPFIAELRWCSVGRSESIEMEVIGDTRASCMISGQENALVNQRSKLCELAGRPQAMLRCVQLASS
jgi:hypothetical protein